MLPAKWKISEVKDFPIWRGEFSIRLAEGCRLGRSVMRVGQSSAERGLIEAITQLDQTREDLSGVPKKWKN